MQDKYSPPAPLPTRPPSLRSASQMRCWALALIGLISAAAIDAAFRPVQAGTPPRRIVPTPVSLRTALVVEPVAACEAAIEAAELTYHLPPGILSAIGLAESGRYDPVTRRTRPWPWAVQAENKSLYFDTKAAAITWVQDAQARGISAIDTGCLQVDLYFHPAAFATLEIAFDPEKNVAYGARFLSQLYAETNDWQKAVGFYHSRTANLADPYQSRVLKIMGAPVPVKPISVASQLASAWGATVEAELPANKAAAARGWDSLLNQQTPISKDRKPPRREQLIEAMAGRYGSSDK